MDYLDLRSIDHEAKELRQRELARIFTEFACAARRAMARLSQRPAQGCPPAPARG